MLTIRDLQSQESFTVPPEGAVLGREGGGADILVRDKSVSKRHAKVYEKGGKWFLEDLQSANGTYIDEQQVTKPVSVKAGTSFALSNYLFEVVGVEAEARAPARGAAKGSSGPAADAWEPDGGQPDQTAPPDDEEWAPEPSQGAGRGSKAPPPPGKNGSAKGSAAKGSAAGAKRPAGGGQAASGVIGMIPSAIAHYLVAAPLMALNPPGFVKRSIEEMKHPPMKPLQLVAWGLPAALFNAGIAIAAAIIVTVVGMARAGAFGAAPIIAVITGSVKALVIAVVVAIVGGFIFHPLMSFIIKLLKGESDELSRSNYYVNVMTGYILLGLPAGAAAIMGILPIPFIAVLPLLFSLIANVVMLLVSYFWLKFFQVAKWVPIVLLILVGVSGVMSALGIVRVVTGGGAVAGAGMSAADAQAAANAAAAAAQALIAANGGTTTTGPGGTVAVPDSGKPGSIALAAATPGTTTAAGTPRGAATPAIGSATPGAAISTGMTPYQRWAAKRDAVEKAIADDPTILRDRELLTVYQRYHAAVYAVKVRWAKARKDPAQEAVVQRLMDAETFQSTEKLIDALYARTNR